MKSRYNIALLPQTISDQVIHLAQQFAGISYQYLLGKKSLPHITLCQFIATEAELSALSKIIFRTLKPHTIQLTFEKFSCFSSQDMNWISLLPNELDALTKMHNTALSLVNEPTKRSSGPYDPHMTLINTKFSTFKKIAERASSTYKPLQDTFILSLGKSDDIGQYQEIISQA